MKLLFPVKKKDYTSNIAASKSWKQLRATLGKDYIVSIFGYSASTSDAGAVE